MPTTHVANKRFFTYVDNFGAHTLAEYGFFHPVALARGAEDILYVANWGYESKPCARITKCTVNQVWIADFANHFVREGQFLFPGGLTLDTEENIYITDQSVRKVVIFDKNGILLGKWGKAGTNTGELNTPSGIVCDRENNIYISDTRNNRIQKFTREGNFLAVWGKGGSGEGELNMPWGITVDSHGDLYIADWGNDRVQKFSPDGTFLATFGRPGSGRVELKRPSDVAVDKDGDVYVADWGNNRVQVYEPDGTYLATFIGEAMEITSWAKILVDASPPLRAARARANLEPSWRFRRPISLTVDDDYRIIIAEAQHSRVQIYKKDFEYENPDINL